MAMKYSEFKPSQFDNHIYIEDREDWLVAPVMMTRDTAAPVALSNWSVIQRELGEESEETYEVHRFNHWAIGWLEIILVHPDLEDKLNEIEGALADYPVLNEDDLSEKETEAQTEAWDNCICSDVGRELRFYAHPIEFDNEDTDAEDYWGELADDTQWEFFSKAMVELNAYWVHTNEGAGVSVDIDDLADTIYELILDAVQ